MFKIIIEAPYKDSEQINELLLINDIYNVVLNVPYIVTTDPNGYGLEELNDAYATFDIYVDESENIQVYEGNLREILKNYDLKSVHIEAYDPLKSEVVFEDIDLENGWVITTNEQADLSRSVVLNSGGAFGTGLHETTRECLRILLKDKLNGKRVLDIGTGSGVLTVGALKAGADFVTAVDVRDVKEEVYENLSLNDIDHNKIEILTGFYNTILIPVSKQFDVVIVNIGGDETLMMIDDIVKHMKKSAMLIVSGLVDWNDERINKEVESKGLKRISRAYENEWVTLVYTF